MKKIMPQTVELRPTAPWMSKQEAQDWHVIAKFERDCRDPMKRAQMKQRRKEYRDAQLPAFLRKQAS